MWSPFFMQSSLCFQFLSVQIQWYVWYFQPHSWCKVQFSSVLCQFFLLFILLNTYILWLAVYIFWPCWPQISIRSGHRFQYFTFSILCSHPWYSSAIWELCIPFMVLAFHYFVKMLSRRKYFESKHFSLYLDSEFWNTWWKFFKKDKYFMFTSSLIWMNKKWNVAQILPNENRDLLQVQSVKFCHLRMIFFFSLKIWTLKFLEKWLPIL